MFKAEGPLESTKNHCCHSKQTSIPFKKKKRKPVTLSSASWMACLRI